MINEAVLRKLQPSDVDRKQQTEAKKRLHNLADRVLHIPRAPNQKIYSNADPRTMKLQRQQGDTDEQEKLRQFANVADDVDKEEKMELQKRELLILKNPAVDGENQPRIEPQPLIRPHSACTFVPAAQLCKTKISLTPRMRTTAQLIINQQQQSTSERSTTNEMMNLNLNMPSSSFSMNNNTRRSMIIKRRRQPSMMSRGGGRSSVSPPNANSNNNNNNNYNSNSSSTQRPPTQNQSSSNPTAAAASSSARVRGRMFSTIEIVTADDDEDDSYGQSTTSTQQNNHSNHKDSTTMKMKTSHRRISNNSNNDDDDGYVEFQAVQKSNGDIIDNNDDGGDDFDFLAPGTVRDLAVKSVSALAGEKYAHLAQRASFGDQRQQRRPHQQNSSSSAALSALLANQRKSVVSGIFRRPSDPKNEKVKVICHGDVRLKVVEKQWSFSPNRRFPKNWQPEGFDDDEEEEEDEDEENTLNDTLDDAFGVAEAKKQRKRNEKVKKEEEPELKLQCVLEWEMEQAKDARELAVTFTERYLKVKDGSCRPLKSQFSALAREELRRKTEDDDDDDENNDKNDDDFHRSIPSITNNNNPSSPTRLLIIMNRLKKKQEGGGENSSPTRHNKISRLPRSSWHVDFSVQEPEKETWKWFTKKLYMEANSVECGSGTETGGAGVNDDGGNFSSSSLLKNITFSGCCKGFNSKKFKIPDPPSFEQQLKAQIQRENDLSRKLARKDSKILQQQQQQKSKEINLVEFLPVISTTTNEDEDFTLFDRIQQQQQIGALRRQSGTSPTSVLPPSLLKAESFRKGGAADSFRASSANLLLMGASFRRNGDSPEPNGGGGGQVLSSSVARFRSRRFDQANALSKQSEEEREMQRRVEEARKAREEERKRRKVLKLESVTFLQCILDKSCDFFRELATEDRLSVSEIRLEHCKLPRIKTPEEIEAERLYKEMQQRYKDLHPFGAPSTNHHHHHLNEERNDEGEQRQKEEEHKNRNPFSSSFVDALEEDENQEDTESLTGTNTNTNTNTAPSYSITPQSKTHNSTTNITPSSASLTATLASRGGVISPFHRNLPLSSLLTPKQRKLNLDKNNQNQQPLSSAALKGPDGDSTSQTSTTRRNSLANSSTDTAVPSAVARKTQSAAAVEVRPLKVAFIEEEKEHRQQTQSSTATKLNSENKKQKHSPSFSSSSSSCDDDDDQQQKQQQQEISVDSFRDIEEDFADAFLNHFVLSQSKTLRVLSLHGTRLTQKFIEKLAFVLRSKQLEKLEHLDIGLCGIESVDETPYTSKMMASAIAHASPSLKSLSLNGTALSPNFVGVSFCAAVRANVNLRKVDCVGCDRGGTKFEAIIQQMLKDRNEEYDRLEKAKLLKVKDKWMSKVFDKRRRESSVTSFDSSFNASAMLQPSKSVRLIDDVVLE